jgi:glycerol-3-phosphate dehydrogenase (NAD(P)+)
MRAVGIIGAGSFGSSIASLVSINHSVLLFTRQQHKADQINTTHEHQGYIFGERLLATTDMALIAQECQLILPIVPSNRFLDMMRVLGPHLTPQHLIIHGTKGLALKNTSHDITSEGGLRRQDIVTMSELIRTNSRAVRVGCLSGPNLADEIKAGLPTASVVASHFDEVIEAGKVALNNKKFHIFGSHDLLGAELAGALKNIIAIGSGLLDGKGMGRNLQAMLITRALAEMIHIGKACGSSAQAFLGTAGIGDLIATATSSKSRNYTFGYRLGQGMTYDEVVQSMDELVEGTRTLRIAYRLCKYYKLHAPIINTLYAIVFHGYKIERAIDHIMTYPYNVDVDFL